MEFDLTGAGNLATTDLLETRVISPIIRPATAGPLAELTVAKKTQTSNMLPRIGVPSWLDDWS